MYRSEKIQLKHKNQRYMSGTIMIVVYLINETKENYNQVLTSNPPLVRSNQQVLQAFTLESRYPKITLSLTQVYTIWKHFTTFLKHYNNPTLITPAAYQAHTISNALNTINSKTSSSWQWWRLK